MILKLLIVTSLAISIQRVAGEKIFIVPTADSPCPEGRNYSTESGFYGYGDIYSKPQDKSTCITLEQYAGLSNASFGIFQLNQILEFASGEHRLNSPLYVANNNTTLFIMMSKGATITCSNEDARIHLEFIENVVMSGITFIGCGEIEISYVDLFTFEYSSIKMSHLILDYTANATITNSTFLCTQDHCNNTQATDPTLIIERSSVLIQQCIFTGLKGPVIVFIFLSNITIDSSKFERNVISYEQDNRSYKWIYFHAVVAIVGSDLRLFQSNFADNVGKGLSIHSDGSLWSNEDDRNMPISGRQIIIDQTTFANNSNDAVHAMISSTITASVRDSIFSKNGEGALVFFVEVIDDIYRPSVIVSSISITSCTFTKNSRALTLNSQYQYTTTTVLIERTNFTENIGAALTMLFYHCDRCSLLIYQTSFVSNQVLGQDQAFNDEYPNIHLGSGSVSIGNGHEPSPYDITLVINNSTFRNNVYTESKYRYPIGVTYVFDRWHGSNQTCIILDSKFINNTAPRGSAIAAFTGDYHLNITDSLFLNNSAKYCGAIGLTIPSATIIGSIFSHNSASIAGGSICTSS